MNIISKNIDIPYENIQIIFGNYDANIKIIESALDVQIVNRDNDIKITGESEKTELAINVIKSLLSLAEKNAEINQSTVEYYLNLSKQHKINNEKISDDFICTTMNGKFIRPKTIGQKKYIEQIKEKMIVVGTGPAGTGKTYLAMAMAITAFKKNQVNRIILTRPAIEAGEKLGFLPGDLQSKVDPYLRPLYDALYEIMGAETFLRNLEKGLIEVAPLAYMRGRTLDNAFIVLDEAQNTTPAQMKMFLTRIGFGSKAVITGDLSQKDLPSDKLSGLDVAIKVLNTIDEIGIIRLTNQDVVRHPLVQKIVDAYDKYEQKNKKS